MKTYLGGGIPYMLASTFFFAGMNLLIKLLSDIPTMELVFFRCGIALLICLTELRYQGVSWKGSNPQLLLLRGIFGTLALFTFFITLKKLPLGTAVTVQYLSPIFTTLFAIPLLQEKVAPLQWLFYAISFGGVFYIKGFQSTDTSVYLWLGLASAMFSGLAYNLVRMLREKENPVVVVLHFQLIGAVSGLAFSIFDWKTPNGTDGLLLLGIGILTYLGQKNLTLALQKEKIKDVSIFNYLGILYALGFGYFFLNEIPDPSVCIGILLVLTGVMLSYWYSQNRTVSKLPS